MILNAYGFPPWLDIILLGYSVFAQFAPTSRPAVISDIFSGVATSSVSTGSSSRGKVFGSFAHLLCSLTAADFTLNPSTANDGFVKLPFAVLMVIEVGVSVIPRPFAVSFVTNVPWLQLSSKA